MVSGGVEAAVAAAMAVATAAVKATAAKDATRAKHALLATTATTRRANAAQAGPTRRPRVRPAAVVPPMATRVVLVANARTTAAPPVPNVTLPA